MTETAETPAWWIADPPPSPGIGDWTFREELARPEALPPVPTNDVTFVRAPVEGRDDRRPEWLQVMDGRTPLWPEKKLPTGDWRLNLDPVRGYLFGRLRAF